MEARWRMALRRAGQFLMDIPFEYCVILATVVVVLYILLK